jgi:hypothetical protein
MSVVKAACKRAKVFFSLANDFLKQKGRVSVLFVFIQELRDYTFRGVHVHFLVFCFDESVVDNS